MKFEELVDFIENTMQPQHIYQPLLIRTLVECGGSATVRQLAQTFLEHDESQIRHYESTIKKMPIPVLTRHGVLERTGDLVKLNTKRLNFEQSASIKRLCDEQLHSFIESRGLSLWDYRLGEPDPVSNSVRFNVLKDSGKRCALCGVTSDKRPLDVDHIIPRSRKGTNDPSNLQALCSKCNRSKGNRDDTDFRSAPEEQVAECLFCSSVKDRIELDNGTVFAIEDGFAVTKGHHLVIPYRHAEDFFELTEVERQHANELLRVLKTKIQNDDPTVTGFNIGMNCGEAAGQTVFHAHIHLIPRRDWDSENPRGGVRNVIPGKGIY
jgi:ATP adenylyltransferase